MSARRKGRIAGALALVALVATVGAASAQTYATLEECVAGYVKLYNLTEVDAHVKCSALFSSPAPYPSPLPMVASPVPLSSPVAVPAASVPPDASCVARVMSEKGLSIDEAKTTCLALYSGSASPPTPSGPEGCIARVQNERGLSYDEAKRHCAFGSASPVPVTSDFETCVAKAMAERGFSKEEAARACAAHRAAETAPRPSAVNVEGCVEKHVLGGMSKEEAFKACASMARAPAQETAPAPRRVAREVVERLKERLPAARAVPESMRSCLNDARGAMEKCTEAGKSAGECRAEVARQMKESCAGPGLPEAEGSGACAARCADVGKTCLASKSEEVCRREGLACLSQCPEAVGRLATLAIKAERFHGLRVNPKEARATDEDQNPLEIADGAMEVRKAAAPPREVRPPAAAAPRTPAEPGAPAPRQLVLSLPVKLAAGKRLAAFQHEASGIAFEQGELSIPMKAGAEIAAHIRAKVREAVGRGQAAEMAVERVMMETKSYEADLSDQRPLVGKVLAKLAADLNDMPENAEIKVTPLAVLGEEKKRAVEEEAMRRGLKVKDVAYAMEVEHKNLASSVENANVTMTVSRQWVEAQGGPEKVRIHREADDGRRELLETVFLGYDGDNAIFEGRSTGLSVFSLVAVEEGVASPTPTPVPTATSRKQPGFEAALALGALLAVAWLWRRR